LFNLFIDDDVDNIKKRKQALTISEGGNNTRVIICRWCSSGLLCNKWL